MSLSAPSLALVQHLRAHGAQTVDDLLQTHSPESRAALYRRLCNLEANRWVEKRERGGVRVWAARADAPQRLRAQRAAQAPAKTRPQAAPQPEPLTDVVPLATPLPVVPPRQLDVMHGPTYRPAPSHVARPGALDAARIASHGTLC
jgi:hypothetical protein